MMLSHFGTGPRHQMILSEASQTGLGWVQCSTHVLTSSITANRWNLA